MSNQNEIRQRITDQIVAALKDGTKLPPWRKPWRTDANAGHPTNVVSKRGYTGINPLLLDLAATRHDLKSKWWGTFRQQCLDHVIVVNERHFLRLLTEYVGHYNRWRPHRSLELRAPQPRCALRWQAPPATSVMTTHCKYLLQ